MLAALADLDPPPESVPINMLVRVKGTPLAEHAARLPAGPSNPDCNAGMSFTALRESAPLP